MLYMLMFLLLATMLSSISINFASNVKNQINLLYSSADNQYTLNNGEDKVTVFLSPVDYTQKDRTIIKAALKSLKIMRALYRVFRTAFLP